MADGVQGLGRRSFIGAAAGLPLGLVDFGASAQARSSLRALVVGADHYVRLRPLSRARADADAVRNKLVSFGYDVQHADNPDAASLSKALDAFIRSLDPRSAAFLFFAGHGVQIAGENYLLPVDADADGIVERGVPLSRMMRDIAARAPKQTIAVFDACRDGPPIVTDRNAAIGFSSVQAPNNFYVAYSAGSGQTALDGLAGYDPDPNGVFTRHFVRNLSPLIPFDAVIKRTRVQVALTARRARHEQNPAIYDQTAGEIWLDGVPRAVARAAPAGTEWGLIPDAQALIVSDNGGCGWMAQLDNPLRDAKRMTATLSALGVAVRWIHQPSREQVLEEARLLGTASAGTKIVYLTGHGVMADEDGAMLLSGDPVKNQGRAAGMGVFPIGLGEINAAIEAAHVPVAETDDKAATRGAGRPLRGEKPARILYLVDACLSSEVGMLERKTRFLHNFLSGEARMRDNDGTRKGKPASPPRPEIGIIYATTPFGSAYEGDSRGSPYSIALLNTLARPGLTVLQAANLMRVEVEDMTDGFQSPIFVCTMGMRDFRLIDPVEDRIAQAPAAPAPVNTGQVCVSQYRRSSIR
ncbi:MULTISPECIES: caspase family protein [unclassified Sphingomonas]|uniref:caspase family protein n=1 Tax=unclassified Sphingomonas TaxID=196159 RepID=UPI002151738F|nr:MULTISPECIES: caspase family protein [unclassified Sphingomonas]MCR5872063.1 caspase family protein [Sphingomonas sp. J344]UUX99652.1 caspase family protein [Sphingomonas sp. J315]